jgi:peptidoglycan/LPS O-acetylase OafA/YrhL
MKHENRLEYLDSIRGLASLTVVLSHFFIAYGIDILIKPINFSPFHFFYDGFAAVTIFFVLSGFVLTLSLNKMIDFNIHSFYIKRIFRIMPSYLFVLILSSLLYLNYKSINTIPQSTNWINEFWSKPLNLNSLAKQAIFIETKNKANLVFQNWTLNIEMIFSFLIPFLFLISKKTNFLTLIIFNVILFSFFNTPVFLFHFSLGVILALHKEKLLYYFSKFEKKYRILFISITILFYTYRFTLPMYYYYYFREFNFLNNDNLIWVITGLGSFLILLYSLNFDFIKSTLNKPFFIFLGRISYSIYLIHTVVLIYLIPKFILLLNKYEIYNKYLIWFLSMIFLLTTTIVVANLLTNTIEKSFVKLGNNLLRKYNFI